MPVYFTRTRVEEIACMDGPDRVAATEAELPLVFERAARLWRAAILSGRTTIGESLEAEIRDYFTSSLWMGEGMWRITCGILTGMTLDELRHERSVGLDRAFDLTANVAMSRVTWILRDLMCRLPEIRRVNDLGDAEVKRLASAYTEEDDHEYYNREGRKLLRQMGLPETVEETAPDRNFRHVYHDAMTRQFTAFEAAMFNLNPNPVISLPRSAHLMPWNFVENRET